ncbi:Rqc2 family fibronectin-binding protein [Paenibacillus tepidiphilus]|uniref:Rqc2 family fibronectin-binding protein n=1 Tax=Paenibacillus tepidiphilus TaxID=2608683 RepID=UPI00123AC745|nr:NFACT RNA binding domain-containing protein [Paenibacillus tepidiphilus]
MALDGIVTRAIVHELQPFIGARIGKIYQPNTHDLIFILRGSGGGGKLLLSANPTYPRLHLTERSSINPAEAPMFCMLLRKHCEGGMIESIAQVGMERIIHIDIRTRDELGDVSAKRIIVELMGRHSNIILTDLSTGIIIDGIHHVTPSISSYRIVMPGVAYTEPPQQHKLNPLTTGKAEFIRLALDAEESAKQKDAEEELPAEEMIEGDIALLAGLGAEKRPDGSGGPSPFADFSGWLVHAFSGVSPLVAGEVALRLNSGTADSPLAADDSGAAQMWAAFDGVISPVRENKYSPVCGANARGKLVYSAIPLTFPGEDPKHYSTISACMEDFYGDKAERDTVKQRVSDLIRFLTNERTKNIKKLDNLHKDLEEAKDADHYRICGELLFASLHAVSKGDKEIRLVNYYDEDQAEITIPLDPLLSPSDNAQRYFKKYNKYKNSLIVINEQLLKTREEIVYLETLLQQLADASLNDIEEIREELVSQGYLRDRSKKGSKKKKKNARPTLQVFTSSEGIDIYVGKNNLQNEYLTNRLAAPGDTWLHTKDIPGSHVVIRSESFGEATLEEAAQLAAYFSQAKQSSSVPVDSTLIRHVRKPSGAKPGFVIYDHQKTLFVTPDEERIKSLPSALKS